MSIHTIPTDSGSVMHLYAGSGVVAFQNKLYFSDRVMESSDTRGHGVLVRAALGEVALQGPVRWPVINPRWPCENFVMMFNVLGTEYCLFFLRENSCHSGHPLSYVDEINPAFRRLQRWMLRCSRSRRAAREMAFSMASHARLGSASLAAVMTDDTLRVVFSV